MTRFYYIFLFFFTFSNSFSQDPLHFTHYSIQDGLPHKVVYNTEQDQFGYIWIATGNGVCRFDGENFKTVEYIPQKSDTSKEFFVKTLYVDRNKNIWIGTMDGLFCYDYKKDAILKINYLFNEITSIYQDKRNRLWIGTMEGLYMLDMISDPSSKIKNVIPSEKINLVYGDESDTIFVCSHSLYLFSEKKLQYEIEKSNLLTSVKAIQKDHANHYWIISEYGLYKYNTHLEVIHEFAELNHKGVNHYLNKLLYDKNGNIWIGTDYNGFYIYYQNGNKIHHTYDPTKSNCPASNNIYNFFEDRDGNVWISYTTAGISKVLTENHKFNFFSFDTQMHDGILSVYADKEDNIWAGTWNGILGKWNRASNKSMIYTSSQTATAISGKQLGSIIEDSYGNIWIGSWNWYLNKLSKSQRSLENPSFIIYSAEKENTNTISGWSIRSMIEDKNKNLWIAYIDNGLEKITINPSTNNLIRKHYTYQPNNKNSIGTNYLWSVLEDKAGKLWLGSENKGAGIFDPITEIYTPLSSLIKNNIDIHRTILCIFEDSSGDIWLGSNGKGIYQYQPTTKELIQFTKNDGLSNNTVYGISEDKQHHLWFFTGRGISRYHKEKKLFVNFYEKDGLKSDVFLPGCINTADSKGIFYIGSDKGIIWFDPLQVSIDSSETKVYITNISINNKEVAVQSSEKKSVLKENILFTDKLELDYTQNNLTFEFNSFIYSPFKKVIYSYQLQGFDNDYITIGENTKKIYYTNIPPGNYIFKLRATRGDGEWSNNTTQLNIQIKPPFWNRWWFRLMLITVFCFSVYLFIRLRMHQIRVHRDKLAKMVKIQTTEIESQKEELQSQANILTEVNSILVKHEKELEHRNKEIEKQSEQLQQLNLTKDKLFSIIGHDLRNPFHAIISLSEMLNKNYSSYHEQKIKEVLSTINQSASGASELLENLLQWAKMQSQSLGVNAEHFNINESIDDSLNVLRANAEKKHIELHYSHSDEFYVYADKMMTTTIIRNLVNNAIKFTEHKGRVWIECQVFNDKLDISICDTGVGMTDDTQNNLFRVASNKSMHGTSGETGIGLGLLVCKEFIDKNKGSIRIESEVNKGSRFIISLPLGDPALVNITVESDISDETENMDSEISPLKVSGVTTTLSSQKGLILVVDDDPAIRASIVLALEKMYLVEQADNGKTGLEKTLALMPDLVISDVMMPEMNGFELCEKIKRDERINHLPVILLTANKTEHSQVMGLETGADDYIIKPFGTTILKARVENMIENRKRLREKFRNEFLFQQYSVDKSLKEDLFIKKVSDIIIANLEDQNFSVDDLAKQINLSRSQLFRKMKQIVDESPVDFIRLVRLKKAVEWLLLPDMNISEVAFRVGFNDASYFSRSFTSVYGESPKKYIERLKNKPGA